MWTFSVRIKSIDYGAGFTYFSRRRIKESKCPLKLTTLTKILLSLMDYIKKLLALLLFFRTFWLCTSHDLCICSSFESLEVQCIGDNDTEKKPSHSLQSLLYTRETLLWSLLLIIIKFWNCKSFSCERFLLKVKT